MATSPLTAEKTPSSVPALGSLKQSAGYLRRRQLKSNLFAILCASTTFLAIGALVWLLYGILKQGLPWLNAQFLTSFPSRFAAKAGVKAALAGSLWVLGITVCTAVPIGVGAAIFLEEYANRSKLAQFVQVNIANLAGVPSIVYGILGLAVFVRALNFERSVLSGGLTLALLVLPIIIIAAQEALRGVPDSLRNGSFALGATKWQTIRLQTLPVAMPGILTGVILALSRAIGETAPLIMMGALTYVAFVPAKLTDGFSTLPIQIFNWTSRPQEEFANVAAAGIIVLLAVLLTMNAIAIFLRHKYNRSL